jgi:hypothetical protein
LPVDKADPGIRESWNPQHARVGRTPFVPDHCSRFRVRRWVFHQVEKGGKTNTKEE